MRTRLVRKSIVTIACSGTSSTREPAGMSASTAALACSHGCPTCEGERGGAGCLRQRGGGAEAAGLSQSNRRCAPPNQGAGAHGRRWLHLATTTTALRTHQLGPHRLGGHASVHGQHKAAAVGLALQRCGSRAVGTSGGSGGGWGGARGARGGEQVSPAYSRCVGRAGGRAEGQTGRGQRGRGRWLPCLAGGGCLHDCQRHGGDRQQQEGAHGAPGAEEERGTGRGALAGRFGGCETDVCGV